MLVEHGRQFPASYIERVIFGWGSRCAVVAAGTRFFTATPRWVLRSGPPAQRARAPLRGESVCVRLVEQLS